LHRAHNGPEYEGDWAWTPPSGARLPGEEIEECARRELFEETGLRLEISPTALGTDGWAIFVAEAQAGCDVVLDAEHDRSLWTSSDDAGSRCLPDHVGIAFRRLTESLSDDERRYDPN
jgi:8-oxo-dGTP pyrophosphatase MutT (NUDIX family)